MIMLWILKLYQISTVSEQAGHSYSGDCILSHYSRDRYYNVELQLIFIIMDHANLFDL